MTQWREVSLGEVATIAWGDTSKTKSSYVEVGVTAYSASGPDGYLPYADRHGDGVVISAIGAQCGKTWLATGAWSCIKNTLWLQASVGTSTKFLYYATADPTWWPRRGAAQPFISLGDARTRRLSLPSLVVQHKIAAVLNSLDRLIENNRRRIELLEQMAQEIYREWFVCFRYPGHEHVAHVDSRLGLMPAGWEVRRLDDLSKIVRGRSYRKHELVESGGVPFVNLKCMLRGGGFRRDGLKRYKGAYSDEQCVRAGDVVMAVTDLTQGREILARATLMPRLEDVFGVISLDVIRIVPAAPNDRLPLVFALRCSDFPERVKELANGSTVLHLSPAHVAAAAVMWPPDHLRLRFADLVAPMVDQINDLSDASDRLAAIRDILVPRLVTGRIDVSKLDLQAFQESVA